MNTDSKKYRVELGAQKFFCRSRWEANYARHLEVLKRKGIIQSWCHEPKTFWFETIKRGVRSYLPDFGVIRLNGETEYHEVKGFMDNKSLTKIRRMKKYYPEVELVLIDPVVYGSLERSMGPIIPGWEFK